MIAAYTVRSQSVPALAALNRPCSRRAAPGVTSRVLVPTELKILADAPSVRVPVARTSPVYSVVSSVTKAASLDASAVDPVPMP